jgi:lipopolysaccharide export system permease protein
MVKKLDWYTVKTFVGPFILIFSILFFIFIVQFAWQEMDKYAGKGLSFFTIAKLLFYLGINVIQLVLPLSILLGSIMTFGGFGERYELAAIKASGISLARILMPVFSVIIMLSVGLYFFGDYAMPYSEKKAKNLAYNIVKTKPTLQLVEGAFIESIPGFSMKISQISGEENDRLKDVFIHQSGNFDDDYRTIIADSGTLNRDSADIRLLKMVLHHGYISVDQIKGKTGNALRNQPNQLIEFETLVQYIDISEIIQKATDEENIQGHYKFKNAAELKILIDSLEIANQQYAAETAEKILTNSIPTAKGLDTVKLDGSQKMPVPIDELNQEQRDRVINEALIMLERDISEYKWRSDDLDYRLKLQAKQKLHYHRNYSYAFTCIVFFFIGAPLGAIVKKGGFGMPVVISIIVFVFYYIINFSSENMAKNGILEPIFAAWAANLVFFPVALLLFYKANHDSALFNLSMYTDPIIKFISKLRTTKNVEHSRYQ